jgi:thiosulfate dehydrogenase
MRTGVLATIACVIAAAIGLAAGYLIWGWPTNWYTRDVTNLPANPENDIIRYGHNLIVNTAKQSARTRPIPKSATQATTWLASTAIWTLA